MKKLISAVFAMFLISGAQAAPVQGNGFIETGPTGPTTIDEWYFSVLTGGEFNILVEGETSDFLDPEINLYTAGGSFLENDDDGWVDQRSSYISRNLGMGDYVLYVSAFNFDGGEQGGPTHDTGDADNDGNIQNIGDYFLTTSGSATAVLTQVREGNLNGTFTTTTPGTVPLPGTLLLIGGGLLGIGLSMRRRSGK